MFLVITDASNNKRVAICTVAGSSIEEIRENANAHDHTAIVHHGGRIITIDEDFDDAVQLAIEAIDAVDSTDDGLPPAIGAEPGEHEGQEDSHAA